MVYSTCAVIYIVASILVAMLKTAPRPKERAPVTLEARRALIAENAYLRAERRGFAPGHETEDWLAAEIEVDALLTAEGGGSPQ